MSSQSGDPGAHPESTFRSVLEFGRRAREPFAWAMAAVCAVSVLIFVVEFLWSVLHEHGGLFETSRRLSGNSLGIGSMALTVAAVVACRLVNPATRHCRQVCLAVGAVVAVSGSADLVLAVLSLIGAPGGVIGIILGLVGDLLVVVVKAAVAVVLLMMSRRHDEDRSVLGSPAPDEGRGRPDGVGQDK